MERSTNSFPRTGKPRRRQEDLSLDSRHYSESASGTAAREHCYIVLRAAVKAETRKDDEEEEEEAGETATAFHHTASLPDPSFFPLLS